MERQTVVAATLGALFCASCGASPGAGAPSGNETDAGEAGTPACQHPFEAPPFDPAGATWPAPAVIHLQGVVDAYNVWLEPGGELRWTVYGCDFSEAGCARWIVAGSDVVVSPPAGMPLEWPRAYRPQSVRLARVSTGTVTALIDTIEGELSEDWEFGAICAECCSGLGPSGLYSCEGIEDGRCE